MTKGLCESDSTSAEQFVYVIQMGNDGPVKIGVAADPTWRVRELQTGNPVPLRILTTFSGGQKLERELHRRLAAHRMNGEWFHPHAEVMAVVRAEVGSVGRTSARTPSPMWRYERCATCDVLLQSGTLGAVAVERGQSPALCSACEEFAELRASGVDPFGE